jgi:hypothetical protein
MNDFHTLILWIRIFTIWAALCATCVPVLYAFYPWYSRPIGRGFMFQAVSFALALDVTVVFSLWPPANIYVIFYIDLFVLTLIGLSTSLLAFYMWRMNRPKKRGNHRAVQ